jgi:AcrR family transcriptional regulator
VAGSADQAPDDPQAAPGGPQAAPGLQAAPEGPESASGGPPAAPDGPESAPATDAPGPGSRRERLRAQTSREIKETARRFLVEQGPDAVTLRAIAREMGMTAPALYRYFGSHEELLRHVVGDIFVEIAGDVRAAIERVADDGMTAKFAAAAREFRRWSLNHPREFPMVFGSPLPGVDLNHPDIADECGMEFMGVFLTLFMELWQKHPFTVPEPGDIEPSLRAQLEGFSESLGGALPSGALLAFAYCWVRLYGMVSMEVYGHLSWILDDAEPMFEMMLREIMPVLGLPEPAPREGGSAAVYP